MYETGAKYIVTSSDEHTLLLAKVDELMRKGERNVTPEESEEIRQMGLALQRYELALYPISEPTTSDGIAELKMYESRLNENF